MRDKNRIKPILKQIEAIWEKNPDLRLCQLLGNCFKQEDLYYIEDELLVESMSKIYCINNNKP